MLCPSGQPPYVTSLSLVLSGASLSVRVLLLSFSFFWGGTGLEGGVPFWRSKLGSLAQNVAVK